LLLIINRNNYRELHFAWAHLILRSQWKNL
jgi:hypothetical protein